MPNHTEFNADFFTHDLILIDSYLPKIVDQTLLISVRYGINHFSDILYYLVKNNPLNYNQSLGHKFYEHKIKQFLSASVLKVIPNILWSDSYLNINEYREINENGLIKYHIINRKIFEENLLAKATINQDNDKKLIIDLSYDREELKFKLHLQGKL